MDTRGRSHGTVTTRGESMYFRKWRILCVRKRKGGGWIDMYLHDDTIHAILHRNTVKVVLVSPRNRRIVA